MRSLLFWLGALILWVAPMACSNGEPATDGPAGDRDHGRALFLTHCALCHGENADGRGQRAHSLVGRPADFTSSAWRRRQTRRQVFETIREGKPGTSMPAWRVLDDREIADLVVYVLTVSEEGP